MTARNINRHRRERQSGSVMIEFALVIFPLIFLLFGSVGVGITMGRFIQAEQVCRDLAHMYSDGIDFSQTMPQNIAVQLASGTGMTTTGGNGVAIFSQIETVYPADCTASGVSPCTNQYLPVFIQRIVVGNSTLRTSTFGTPAAAILDAQGNISPSVYLSNSNSSVRASGFEADLEAAATSAGVAYTPPVQTQGEVAYVVEVFFRYPDLSFLGFGGAGGAYTSFMFQ